MDIPVYDRRHWHIHTCDATVDPPVSLSDSHMLDVHPHTHTVHEFFFHVQERPCAWRVGGREEGRGVSPENGGSSALYSTLCVWNHQLYFSVCSWIRSVWGNGFKNTQLWCPPSVAACFVLEERCRNAPRTASERLSVRLQNPGVVLGCRTEIKRSNDQEHVWMK